MYVPLSPLFVVQYELSGKVRGANSDGVSIVTELSRSPIKRESFLWNEF